MTASLTGTPGVGKTSVANVLRSMDYSVLDLNDFIIKKDLRGIKDVPRDTYEVDISLLNNKHSDELSKYDIVEGHLSHHLDLSPIIILRCSPIELRKRVEAKDWHQAKIEENMMAEILDVILLESLEYDNREVYEIDTTDIKPQDAALSVIDILKGDTTSYAYGRIDWSEHLE